MIICSFILPELIIHCSIRPFPPGICFPCASVNFFLQIYIQSVHHFKVEWNVLYQIEKNRSFYAFYFSEGACGFHFSVNNGFADEGNYIYNLWVTNGYLKKLLSIMHAFWGVKIGSIPNTSGHKDSSSR